MRYKWDKRKSDANQTQIVEELRQAGCSVWVVSHCRKALDLIVGWRDYIWWVELKTDPSKPFTDSEKKILELFSANPHVIVGYSAEDILRKIGAMK